MYYGPVNLRAKSKIRENKVETGGISEAMGGFVKQQIEDAILRQEYYIRKKSELEDVFLKIRRWRMNLSPLKRYDG